ncbi:hypothetical protein FOXYSP1_14850 [Fusarium oxysporum f. sp. phaseoli]
MPQNNEKNVESSKVPSQHSNGTRNTDWLCLRNIIIWQVLTMINMGLVLCEWNGWKKERYSAKGRIIFGALQTILLGIVLIQAFLRKQRVVDRKA